IYTHFYTRLKLLPSTTLFRSKITELTGGKFPTWNAFVAHPSYDEYWKARGSGNYLKPTSVATLVVGGWWDQEDYYGALATYEALDRKSTRLNSSHEWKSYAVF